MDNSTDSLREQGIQAFKDGDLDRAVDLLARAVMADDNDAESRTVLGIVYSQKGLHDQAKRALENAVALEPQNAKFIYNLGLARERAGDMQGAALAFADTLKVDPKNAHAKARLDAMGPQAAQYLAARPKPSEPVGVPHTQPEADPQAGGLNAMPGAPLTGGAVMASAMPASAPPAAGLAAGSFAGGMGAEETGPPGTVKCDACGQWSQLGMTCEFCQSALRPPAPVAHAAPPVRPPVGAGTGGGIGGGTGSTWYEDKFDIKEAYVDWLNVLVRPGEFFQEQADREGLNAPLSFLFACGSIVAIAGAIIRWTMKLVGSATGADTSFIGLGFQGVCLAVSLCILMFICAGFVHLLARLFGGQGTFSGTFRAVAYAGAPITLFYCVGTLLQPVITRTTLEPALKKVAPGSTAPSRSALPEGSFMVAQAGADVPSASGRAQRGAGKAGGAGKKAPSKADVKKIGNLMSAVGTAFGLMMVIQLPGYIWAWCLLALALTHVQKLSTGSAASVVAITVAVIAGIAGTLLFVFQQAIAGLMGMAAGAAGAGGASGAPPVGTGDAGAESDD